MFNPGMANMQGMMKKVQKMQQEMLKLTVEKITIAPSAVDPDDVEMLEDLVTTAVNEAMRKVEEMTEREMGKLTGGMKLPGMF